MSLSSQSNLTLVTSRTVTLTNIDTEVKVGHFLLNLLTQIIHHMLYWHMLGMNYDDHEIVKFLRTWHFTDILCYLRKRIHHSAKLREQPREWFNIIILATKHAVLHEVLHLVLDLLLITKDILNLLQKRFNIILLTTKQRLHHSWQLRQIHLIMMIVELIIKLLELSTKPLLEPREWIPVNRDLQNLGSPALSELRNETVDLVEQLREVEPDHSWTLLVLVRELWRGIDLDWSQVGRCCGHGARHHCERLELDILPENERWRLLGSEDVEEGVGWSEGDHGSLGSHGLLRGSNTADWLLRHRGHGSGEDGDGSIRPGSEGRSGGLGDIIVKVETAARLTSRQQ